MNIEKLLGIILFSIAVGTILGLLFWAAGIITGLIILFGSSVLAAMFWGGAVLWLK